MLPADLERTLAVFALGRCAHRALLWLIPVFGGPTCLRGCGCPGWTFRLVLPAGRRPDSVGRTVIWVLLLLRGVGVGLVMGWGGLHVSCSGGSRALTASCAGQTCRGDAPGQAVAAALSANLLLLLAVVIFLEMGGAGHPCYRPGPQLRGGALRRTVAGPASLQSAAFLVVVASPS